MCIYGSKANLWAENNMMGEEFYEKILFLWWVDGSSFYSEARGND